MNNISNTMPRLCDLPEIAEIDETLTNGIGPLDIIEVTLPHLSPQMRTLLQSYLKRIEEEFAVMTELMSFDDMDMVLITMLPSSGVTSVMPRA